MIKEYILCAAIWYNDGLVHCHQPRNIETGYVMCGRRHHNIINTRFVLTSIPTKGEDIQGFITSKDRFVDRAKAANIAYFAGQTETKLKTLFSEDLY